MSEEKKSGSWQDTVSDWLISIIVAVVLAFGIRTFLVEPYMVSGPSMMNTLQDRERLLVNKLVYYTRQPKRGEIIVFKYPSDTRRDFIKRVIAVSGTPALSRSKEQAVACTNELMEALGCKTVADLQKVDVDKLVSTASALLPLRVAPERDGDLLPLNPWEAVANGAVKDIDFLQGVNKDEMNFFLVTMGGPEPFNEWASEVKAMKYAPMTDEERALADGFFNSIQGESYEPYTRLFSQIMFNAPCVRMSEEQTKAGGKMYTYHFTVESSLPLMKSGHGVSLPAMFKHPDMDGDTGRAFDETFSKTVRKMFVQFAKTGNPSLTAELSPDGKAKVWPLYDLKDKQVMVLDEFIIHPEKESQRKIVDWERTYFLTKYFSF